MSNRILVGTRKGLFTYQRGNNPRWRITRTDFLGDPVTMVLPGSSRNPGDIPAFNREMIALFSRTRGTSRGEARRPAPKGERPRAH